MRVMMRRNASIALVVMLAACGSSGEKRAQSLRPVNVVLITIDTLRADRLGCYGYANIETPNLDRLAMRGVLFENAVAQAPLTSPSHASMFTGLYPTVHKVRDTGGFVLHPEHTTLAEVLQQQGWETAAFVGASVLKQRFGLNQGFTVYDDEMGAQQATGESPERPAGEVVRRAIKWLDTRSGKPYFLWVHVFDPHLPYEPPSPFREKYRGREYDGEIAYVDDELGRLFQRIEKKSPVTLIAVLSDHGESFSEHGEYAHGVFLYDTTMRIPFLMAGPGVPSGMRVKQQARSIDLLPTVLELMGGKVPEGVQGASLTPAFTGKQTPAAYAYMETLFPRINMGWTELRAIRTDRWKYIRAPRPELYDLARDPGESTNVIGHHAAELRELEAQLKSISPEVEKIETAPVDQRTMQQLRSLGYLGGSAQREFTLTGKGVDPKDRLEVLKLLHLAVYADQDISSANAISLLRQAVAADAANPSLYTHLGDVYRRAGRTGEEIQLYESGIGKGIRSAALNSRLGALYMRQGNTSKAMAAFEQAAQLNPHDHESLQNLAVAYRGMGRVADAERVLNAIIASGEEFAPAYNELGMVAFQKGEIAKARELFEKAAQLDGTYQLNLGRLYRMAGEKAKARAAYDAFLSAASSRPEYRDLVQEARKELARLE
jgi:arylsulfatase A-like enzyme/Flp pilus assembly protein TadD